MNTKVIITIGADCLLENGPIALVSDIKRELTVANPAYLDAKKYGRWIGKKIKPHLYFYSETSQGLRFPRGFANQAVRLCRHRAGADTPRIIDHRRTRPEVDFSFTGELRPYQIKAFEDTVKRDFGVIESGTGSGKTVIGLAVIAHRHQPTLVLVHTKELLYQWAAQIELFLGCKAGLIGDGHFAIEPVTVAIVNSARKRLDILPQQFGQICVDECHRVPATLFTEVVTAFDCRYALGLSATAFRRDGLTNLIHLYLGDCVHRVAIQDLHRSGAVLQPEYLQRPTEFNYDYRGNYQNLLKALTGNKPRNQQICTDIVSEAGREKGTLLVVSDRVAHCEELAKILTKLAPHLKVAILTGKIVSAQRLKMVEEIRQGEVDVLISTVQLIGEGFDCPGLRALFLTTPIKFSGRLLQVVGRILRPAVNKQPRVYDYVDPPKVLQSSARARSHIFNNPESEAKSQTGGNTG